MKQAAVQPAAASSSITASKATEVKKARKASRYNNFSIELLPNYPMTCGPNGPVLLFVMAAFCPAFLFAVGHLCDRISIFCSEFVNNAAANKVPRVMNPPSTGAIGARGVKTGEHQPMKTMVSAAAAFLVAIPLWAAPAAAEELPAPQGEVIFTLSGKVGKTNTTGGTAEFDRAMLEALPARTITTNTPWYEDEMTFEGPLVRDVLALAEGSGEWATVTALDEYAVDIPVSDFLERDPILAMKRNGETMPDDDKGPLFIIYDYDSDPALDTDEIHSRSVWSVRSIALE